MLHLVIRSTFIQSALNFWPLRSRFVVCYIWGRSVASEAESTGIGPIPCPVREPYREAIVIVSTLPRHFESTQELGALITYGLWEGIDPGIRMQRPGER